MTRVNDIVCKYVLDGWCDQLEKYPRNYLFTFILTIVVSYGVPLVMIGIMASFCGSLYIDTNYLDLFSSTFPAISVIFMFNASLGVVITGMIVLVLNFFYMVYMARQLGVYVLLPVVVEIARWIVIVFFKGWIVIAIVLALIPFMTFAVASHYITYKFGTDLTMSR
jgi:hypothetical protein